MTPQASALRLELQISCRESEISACLEIIHGILISASTQKEGGYTPLVNTLYRSEDPLSIVGV